MTKICNFKLESAEISIITCLPYGLTNSMELILKVKHQKAMLNQFVLFGSVIFQFNGLNITNWQGGLEKRYKKTLEILFFSNQLKFLLLLVYRMV
jgi:hypothetical protein